MPGGHILPSFRRTVAPLASSQISHTSTDFCTHREPDVFCLPAVGKHNHNIRVSSSGHLGLHPDPTLIPPSQQKCCPSSQEWRRKGCCEGKDSNQPVGKVILPPLSSQAGGCPNELWKAGHHTGSLRQPCLPNPFWPVPAAAPPAVLSDVPTLTETSQQPHSPPHRLHQGCSHLLIPCDLTKSQGAGK